MWRASFCIGEVSLGISGDSTHQQVFSPQLELFRSEQSVSDIEISLQWVERLSQPPGDLLFDSGSVWELYEDSPGLLFDFSSPVISPEPYKRLRVDRGFHRALLQLNRNCFPDPSACNPLEYPLDELLVMHRLGRERGVEVHAAGLRDSAGNGYLFLGHSGAGKSTTTRLWTEQHNVTVLSDDRIILRKQSGREHDGMDEQGEVWMHGTPWHGEAAFAAPEKARIERLFLLDHGPENRISALSGSRAVGELMARSFLPFYDAAALASTMTFLQEITDAIPCYRLEFRPDRTAVEAVLRFQP